MPCACCKRTNSNVTPYSNNQSSRISTDQRCSSSSDNINQRVNSNDLPPSYHELTILSNLKDSSSTPTSALDGKASYDEWLTAQKKLNQNIE